jgi:heme exporter protein B
VLVPELGIVLAIARKDLLQELRSRAVTVATVFFSGIVLIILAFAIGQEEHILEGAAPGVLWVALAFSGVISAAQSYQSELEETAFEQLLLYPVPRATIFLGKLLANWLYMVFLGSLMLPVSAVFFDMPLGPGWPLLLLTVLLGTFGFGLIATFYAALTANLRARESLLPVLMFPVVVPILLAAVRATGAIVQLGNFSLSLSWLQLLAGFDLVYLVVCTAIFHFVVEE